MKKKKPFRFSTFGIIATALLISQFAKWHDPSSNSTIIYLMVVMVALQVEQRENV